MYWILYIFVINYYGFNSVESEDQIAPGVSSEHYQQYQHQVLQTQIPIIQYRVPDNHALGHEHHHSQPQQVLNVANIAHEKAHIAEHLDVPMDTNKMSEQELQFHYFKMHDSDNNNKLDGCELIKSLIHWHEEGNKELNSGNIEEKIFKDEELITLIDPILEMDDSNQDGYIDYPEFIQAQQRATSTNQQ